MRLRALALCGPTASGKSELASRLAAEIGGEVVNADSRQIYAGMRIGTGWPSDEQFARAPHHGYGTIAAGDRIAQLVLVRVELPTPVEVESLTDTERGSGGFGSSGS